MFSDTARREWPDWWELRTTNTECPGGGSRVTNTVPWGGYNSRRRRVCYGVVGREHRSMVALPGMCRGVGRTGGGKHDYDTSGT